MDKFDYDFDEEAPRRVHYTPAHKRYKYDCRDRTCGAPDCNTCRNGPPPWEEEEEEEEE